MGFSISSLCDYIILLEYSLPHFRVAQFILVDLLFKVWIVMEYCNPLKVPFLGSSVLSYLADN